jgi:hypothetical protein
MSISALLRSTENLEELLEYRRILRNLELVTNLSLCAINFGKLFFFETRDNIYISTKSMLKTGKGRRETGKK